VLSISEITVGRGGRRIPIRRGRQMIPIRGMNEIPNRRRRCVLSIRRGTGGNPIERGRREKKEK
jgi:hypothetical protein